MDDLHCVDNVSCYLGCKNILWTIFLVTWGINKHFVELLLGVEQPKLCIHSYWLDSSKPPEMVSHLTFDP